MHALDVMALAISEYEGSSMKDRNYRNNNPGNLRDSPMRLGKDEQGYCIFANFTTGYLALLRELRFKFSGKTSTRITSDSSLLDFFLVYAPSADGNYPMLYASFVADRLKLYGYAKSGMIARRCRGTPG